MKKNIILIFMLTIIPYGLCILFSLFSDKIRIGQGNNNIESHRLNKDVLIEIDGLYKSMDVEEYILGVLPGTIPADYDEETLKVQAILIRTNVLKEMEEKGTADASDLSYEYLTVEERRVVFGKRNYERYNKRFENAVVETSGQVLRQEGSLIMALYHEVSIGKTMSAKEILGEDIAYLQSVDSSQDVEAKHYMNIVNYTWEELQMLSRNMKGEPETTFEEGTEEKQEEISENAPNQGEGATAQSNETEENDTPEKEPTGESLVRTEIKVEESTENGYVTKVSVDGIIYTGEELANGFNLASANFYVEEIEGGLRFVCLGKGNALGVSQYGANRMALNGKDMEEIIKHYLQKVSIEEYRNN